MLDKEIKWTKFSDTDILCNLPVYVTDYKSVRILNSGYFQYYLENHPEHSWAEIPVPEVPENQEKKRHSSCANNKVQCFETRGILILHQIGCMPIEVNFCPLCGYAPTSS